MRMRTVMVVAIGIAIQIGCQRSNPFFCGNLNGPGCACAVNEDCATDLFPICDPSSHTCVQCSTEHLDICAADRLACIDNTCASCTEHAQCGYSSNVCTPDGKCADPLEVAYLDASGTDNPDCTKDTPCTKLSAALATNRPLVKFTGTIDESVNVVGDRAITFLADPGARLIHSSGDSRSQILGVGPDTRLYIYDLEIGTIGQQPASVGLVSATLELTRTKAHHSVTGGVSNLGIQVSGGSLTLRQSAILGTGAALHAESSIVTAIQSIFERGINLENSTATFNQSKVSESGIRSRNTMLTIAQSEISSQSIGVDAGNGGFLRLTRSTISDNLQAGIWIQGVEFDVANNLFVRNGGSPTNGGGAVAINPPDAGTRRFEFNTITGNFGRANSITGVSCNDMQPITLSGNIVYDNAIGESQRQVAGCLWTYSNIGPGVVTQEGLGNRNANPMFVDPAQDDFHLRPESPLRNAADPNATLTEDIDGDPRPQDGLRDIGFDEIMP